MIKTIIHLRPTLNFKQCMNCGKFIDNKTDKWYYKSKQFHKLPKEYKCEFK